MELFLEEAEPAVTAIREAVRQGDAPALQSAAHRLKGGAALIGATEVRDLAADLDRLAREGSVAGAAPLLDALEVAFARARTALEAQSRL
jgi:HPt (histidine-containing phosphotransfer) domain-containing protein